MNRNKSSGFSLIELLVVLALIALMVTISLFALDQARRSSRDARRKTDLETIKNALEIYKSDCHDYPANLPAVGATLTGDNTPAGCANSNTYLSKTPGDPQTNSSYAYRRLTATTYTLCAYLEQSPVPAVPTTNCGTCTGGTCNYRVTNP
jgi:general secretion pathway protein G